MLEFQIMQHPGWTLIVLGGLIIAVGLIWLVAPSFPWLGRLPGDLAIERDNFSFYFPLTTCLLLSGLVTAIVWLIRYFSR